MLSNIIVFFTYCNFIVEKEKQSVPDEIPTVFQAVVYPVVDKCYI